MEATPEIKIYGTKWCGDCRRALRVLDNNQVPYTFIDIDQNPEGRKFVIDTNNGNRSVPTIVFPDGSILVEPSNKELENQVNAQQD